MPVEWFPDVLTDKNGNVKLEDTPANFDAMLKAYGIELWINEMTNKKMAYCPTEDWSGQTWSYIKPCITNLMGTNRLPRVYADKYIQQEVYHNVRHPVKQWMDALPEWDGKSRLLEVYGTVVTSSDFPIAQKTLYLKKFFLQCVGAIYDKRFQQRGVLVLQGRQSIGKTTWFKSLAPADKKGFIGDSLTLKNPDSNKDEVMKLLSHWISELGELDRTTRKADIGSIKAFLTAEDDEYRKPYAEEVECYKRKTVIVGTVNNDQFLVDDTGSTRFWAMPVTGFTPLEVDLEQFWAEVKEMYFALLAKKTPYLYWLSPEEDTRREVLNDPHQVKSIWEDLIAKYYGAYDGRPDSELHFVHAQDLHKAINTAEGRENAGIVDDFNCRKINRAAEALGYRQGKSKDGRRRGFYLPSMKQVLHD
jgi:putative DNA primase/helicase